MIINDINYLKYIKYKKKYLELKRKILEITSNEEYLEGKKYKNIQTGGESIQINSLSSDDIYVILFNCFIEHIVNKNLNNKYRYNFLKSYASFIINIYNNRKNEIEDYKNFLDYIKQHCNLEIKKSFNIADYSLEKITYKKESVNNKNKYYYVITYRYKNEIKTSYIKCDILKTNIIYKTTDDIEKILLIYKILGLETGMFWGLNPKVYSIFEDDPNAIECFASPFNHTLSNYYSVLPIDKAYGSKGNFFDRFLESKYTTYIMNPPFTAYLIVKMFDKIYEKLEKDKCCIFVYIPKWDDLNDVFYDKINSKYRIFKHNLLSNTSYVYNYIEEKNILASFDLTIFLVTNDYKEEYFEKYKKMIEILEKK